MKWSNTQKNVILALRLNFSCNKFCIYLCERNQTQNHCISPSFGVGVRGKGIFYLSLICHLDGKMLEVWGGRKIHHTKELVWAKATQTLKTRSATT